MIAAVDRRRIPESRRPGTQDANQPPHQPAAVPVQVIEVRVVIDLRLPGQQEAQVHRISLPALVDTPAEHIAAYDAELPGPAAQLVVSDSLRPAEPATARPGRMSDPSQDSAEPSLEDLYRTYLAPGEMQRNEPATVRRDIKRIQQFSNWLTDARINTPRIGQKATIGDISENVGILHEYGKFLRSKDAGASTATTSNALNAILKLLRWAVEAGRLERLPKIPTRGDLNLMSSDTSSSEAVPDDEEFQGEPVLVAEMQRLMAPHILAECQWPELGNVPPSVFWETVLLSHAVYGFRSQDWFAISSPHKLGLLWSGVLADPVCPRNPELQNAPGWIWYLVHKTKKKSKRADKPQQIVVPICERLRSLLEQFRGIDESRVFPLPHTPVSWSREFRRIKERAGLDDATRTDARRPIIRLSEGKRAIASFRKGCAAMWADHVSESVASYLLKHSVSVDKVSDTTRTHYLQAYRPLTAIVPALESLPILRQS